MLHKQLVFASFGPEFNAHGMQSPTTVDQTGKIEFALKPIHEPVPTVFLYVPAPHAEQPPAVTVYPMLHKQLVFASFGPEFNAHGVQSPTTVDQTGEIEFALQPIHEPAPKVFLYVPAPHAEQPPAVTVYPMLHKQLVFASFGPEFNAHGMQSPTTVDPTGKIEFALQPIHKPVPMVFLYVPAPHCKQFAAFPVYPMLHKQTVFAGSGAEFSAHFDTVDTVQ